MLTIHHKHKHKGANNHHITASFNTPSSYSVSSHIFVPIKELDQNYKQTLVDAASIITEKIPLHTMSRQNNSLNSTNTEHLKPFDLLNDKHQISHWINEAEVHEQSIIIDNCQLPSSKILNKSNFLSSNNLVQLDTNSVPLEKKILRINHYPNMLADFD